MASDTARAHTRAAFDAVRSRARVGRWFVVAAHAALGGAFGSVLAWTGQGGPWTMAVLSLVAAAGSAAWAAGRIPVEPAGILIEHRFPECRNVMVTADELLAGVFDAPEEAQARVFQRAAAVLSRIDYVRAAAIGRRVTVSLIVIAASMAVIVLLWR